MEKNTDIVILAKTKLADRPVVWKEAYTKRTLFLKKQFHDVLGPGSYFRWEGHDTETDDNYFVVVGPAKVHSPKAEFFAGVRKLPADYAAGGLYFHDLDETMNYAHETWGVSIPKEIRYYDSNDLKGIDQKIKKWKEATEDDDINNEDYLIEWYESIKHGEETVMPVSNSNDSNEHSYFYEQSSSYPFFTRIAMPTWLRHEPGFKWWDVNQVFSGDEDFQTMSASQPSLIAARDALIKEKVKRQKKIAEMYGPEYASEEAGLYGVWLVHRADRGTYIVSVGPYCGTYFEQALDKFGVFTKKVNAASDEEIQTAVTELMQMYAATYGLQLDQGDLKIPAEGSLNPSVELGASGRSKLYHSPGWKAKVLDAYGVEPGAGMTAKLKRGYAEKMAIWKAQCDAAYAEGQEKGLAFEAQSEVDGTKPPSISLIKRPIGQQQSRSILRQNVAGMDKLEAVEKFGFDSFKEAIDFLETTGMPGAPIGDIPPTTNEDLKAARMAKKERDQNAGAIDVKQRKVRTPSQSAPEKMDVKQDPALESKTEMKTEEPLQSPDIVYDHSHDDDRDSLFAKTSLLKMIKMAEDLDSRGKYKEAEGIHRLLKKHIIIGSEQHGSLRGSQRRETLEEAQMQIVKRIDANDIILKHTDDPRLPRELWTKNDNFAGNVIEINGQGYKFVRTWLQTGDQLVAGIL